jgi:hypothetical protein
MSNNESEIKFDIVSVLIGVAVGAAVLWLMRSQAVLITTFLRFFTGTGIIATLVAAVAARVFCSAVLRKATHAAGSAEAAALAIGVASLRTLVTTAIPWWGYVVVGFSSMFLGFAVGNAGKEQ